MARPLSAVLLPVLLVLMGGCAAPVVQMQQRVGPRALASPRQGEDPSAPSVTRGAPAPAPDEATQAGRPLSGIPLLAAGAEALNAGDPATAAEHLAAYVASEPGNATAQFLLGVALLDLGRRVEAEATLQQAVRLDPSDVGTRAVHGRVLFELGRLDEALATLRQVVADKPEEARHWTSLGLVAFDARRWEESYQAFLSAVERNPRDLAAHRGLGRLYAAAGRHELAARSYRTALGLAPSEPTLHVALGHVLRDLGRSSEALEHYRTARQIDPDNAWIDANLGSTYLELDQPELARQHLEDALVHLFDGEASPGLALVHLNHGMALAQLGDLDGAQDAYELALEHDAELAEGHEMLGTLFLDRGDTHAARDHLQRALELSTLPSHLAVELLVLHEQAGDWDAALDVAHSLLGDQGTTPGLSFGKAQVLLRSKHPHVHDSEAAAELLLPLVQGPLSEHPPAWLMFADALVEQGEVRDAVEALDQVLADRPAGDPAWAAVAERAATLAARLERR